MFDYKFKKCGCTTEMNLFTYFYINNNNNNNELWLKIKYCIQNTTIIIELLSVNEHTSR